MGRSWFGWFVAGALTVAQAAQAQVPGTGSGQAGGKAAAGQIAVNEEGKGAEMHKGLRVIFPVRLENKDAKVDDIVAKVEKVAGVDKAKVDEKRHGIWIHVKPGQTVKLSDVAAATEGTGVVIEKGQVALGAHVRVAIAGMTCPECVKKVKAAFETRLSNSDTPQVEIGQAVLQLKPGATLTTLNEALKDSNQFKITDVIWKAPELKGGGKEKKEKAEGEGAEG